MIEAKAGRIINIASTAGLRGYKTMVAYCAAKHGMIGMTRALALEMGGPALQSAAFERFHSAHFREGLAIDDHEVLQRAAAEAGLDERRVSAVLADDAYADEVRGDEELARSMGVTSVPFVLANGYAAISGARSIDDYLGFLRGVVTQRV